ncbi:hypothetical protein ABIE51_001983 [Lysobacter sp. OAE881]|uniref:hypothetical protein n=1 Tax=Lysobacter sp. OAE881 TaxID=2663813 RepID=UPI00178B0FD5
MNLPVSSALEESYDTSVDDERLANAIVERRQLAQTLAASIDELRRTMDRRQAGVDAFKSIELMHAKLPPP